ncbi:DEAD/DEAH box helicase [Shewanella decolorationis]|uniref:ATP-dependent RNA helicase RhlE n=1 Tax=Shewanella decolorationis S12 TaxID=1353536 RepID=A0ABN0PH70_9GAMM|nr:DEAD/DEAH box helicase [Shewanella decolorationis]ESE39364.1 DEAD/DEAH box helicase domain-containing protein [Shewanella decolorationis S12]GLR33340.1 ATP-dependent RNA helicase RhlE [Shewanella decolorationis]
MSFSSLGLSAPIQKAVTEQGYDTPSPIQAQAIPAVLTGKDVMAAAQTGTGKTAGFTLPLLELLSKGHKAKAGQIRALVLTPTRELAAQVSESVETYGKYLPLRSAVVFGGVPINPQIQKLRHGVDILVATPGRLLDLEQQKAVKFNQLEVLVLDEADRMLDMGFIRDIKKILAMLPTQRQNLMFSATFSDEIRELAKGLVNQPVEISVTPRNAAANTVKQWICPVDKNQKSALLIQLIKQENWQQVLVFSRTKHGANRLAKSLIQAEISAAAIHGNKSQGARTKALADFKSGEVRVLVATDIAARGLDIDQLPQVVNFDLPNVPEDYVHRIGRTGRAGALGQAVSLVSNEETKLLRDIERLINRVLERQEVEGFSPVHALPESTLNAHGKENKIKAVASQRKHRSAGKPTPRAGTGRDGRKTSENSSNPATQQKIAKTQPNQGQRNTQHQRTQPPEQQNQQGEHKRPQAAKNAEHKNSHSITEQGRSPKPQHKHSQRGKSAANSTNGEHKPAKSRPQQTDNAKARHQDRRQPSAKPTRNAAKNELSSVSNKVT